MAADRILPVKNFVKTLQGTHDEVWTKLLLITHKNENRPVKEWQGFLAQYKTELAHKKG